MNIRNFQEDASAPGVHAFVAREGTWERLLYFVDNFEEEPIVRIVLDIKELPSLECAERWLRNVLGNRFGFLFRLAEIDALFDTSFPKLLELLASLGLKRSFGFVRCGVWALNEQITNEELVDVTIDVIEGIE